MTKKPKYSLKVRSYPDTPFVSVWIIRADGAARAAILHGQVLPALADELAEVTGLKIEKDHTPLPAKELAVTGCIPASKQKTLFDL